MGSLLSRVVLGAGVAVALSASAPGCGWKQARPGASAPTQADKQAARGLVDEGIAAMDARDYARAVALYTRAFAVVPHPILLFNIGQAYRLAGHPDRAVPYYEHYLQREPGGEEAAAARAWLTKLDAAGATGRPAKAREPRPARIRERRPAKGAETRPAGPAKGAGPGKPRPAGTGKPRPAKGAETGKPPRAEQNILPSMISFARAPRAPAHCHAGRDRGYDLPRRVRWLRS